MYILSIFAVIIGSLLMAGISENGLSVLVYYFDTVSILLLLVICIPVLISSSMFRDFNNAFAVVIGNKEKNLTELKRALEAVKFVMSTLLYSALFIAMFSVILMLHSLTDVSVLGPNIAVCVLPLVYAFAIDIVLLPIKGRLILKITNYMQE